MMNWGQVLPSLGLKAAPSKIAIGWMEEKREPLFGFNIRSALFSSSAAPKFALVAPRGCGLASDPIAFPRTCVGCASVARLLSHRRKYIVALGRTNYFSPIASLLADQLEKSRIKREFICDHEKFPPLSTLPSNHFSRSNYSTNQGSSFPSIVGSPTRYFVSLVSVLMPGPCLYPLISCDPGRKKHADSSVGSPRKRCLNPHLLQKHLRESFGDAGASSSSFLVMLSICPVSRSSIQVTKVD